MSLDAKQVAAIRLELKIANKNYEAGKHQAEHGKTEALQKSGLKDMREAADEIAGLKSRLPKKKRAS